MTYQMGYIQEFQDEKSCKKQWFCSSEMGRKSHVMAVPHPAQGHVAPLMKLGCGLAGNGIKVTFVLTDTIFEKIESAMPKSFAEPCPIRLVSIPQGFLGDLDNQDTRKAMENAPIIWRVHLQNLIVNANNDEPVTHVIADIGSGWALEVAKKMCIKAVAFVPYGMGTLALVLHVPRLIEAGILDNHGIPIKEDSICLSEDIPAWNVNELFWSHPSNSEIQKFLFINFFKNKGEYVRISDCLIVNSFYELEPSACDMIPDILPIGPLLANTHISPFSGNLWPEDSTCLSWLDKQPTGSVIYAAFGSISVCNEQQFNEVAHGLEMTGQPFLWVVRPDFFNGKDTAEFPDSFLERIENHGKIVKWAPQEKVLAHPSMACFFSHCGWNSTMEGVNMGVPFLCWPYFHDQFHNKDYICEGWKVGLAVNPDDNGIVTRHEIKTKIEKLLCDGNIKANSLKLKEMARKSISEGGSSHKNFISFVELMQQ